MIISREHYQFETEDQHNRLAKQLSEYRKCNASLKKKIKVKDRQINYLFNCIQQFGPGQSGIQSTKTKTKNHSDVTPFHQIETQLKRKQKQNANFYNQNDNNSIFKQKSTIIINKGTKEDIKLPSLEKRNIFFDQHHSDQKPKLIKISAQKLVALKPQQVRKKFQMKFKKSLQ